MEAEVREPNRDEYPDNLGGAFEFSVTHFIYKTLEIAGGSIGVFLGGSLVKFLETVEPHMVQYVSPLIDGVLAIPDLPDWIQDYLRELQHPENEVGAALLAATGSSVVGGVVGSLFGTLLAGPTQSLNKGLRLTLPDPGTAYALARRGLISWDDVDDYMARSGYHDRIGDNLNEVLRPRLDNTALSEGIRRGNYSTDQMRQELVKRGFTEDDQTVTLGLIENLLDLGSIMTAYYRNTISLQDAEKRISKLGFNTTDSELIMQNSQVIPGVGDLVQMAVREAWDDSLAAAWGYDADFSTEFAEWAQKQGLSPEWSKRYWRSHWQLPSVSLGFQMYHRKLISRDQLEGLLKTADYPAGWRGPMIEAAYSPITRVDVRRFYRLGLFDHEDLLERYGQLGFSPADSEGMAAFTELYEGGDPETEYTETRSMTRSLLEKAYRVGKLTREEAAFELGKLLYAPEHVELLLSLVDITRELDGVPDFLTEYRNDMRNLILKSYTKRMISASDVTEYLVVLGFDPQEAELQMQVSDFAYADAVNDKTLDLIGDNYVRRTITRTKAYELVGALNLASGQQDQIFGEWDLARTLRTRKLTQAQYLKAVKAEMITLDEYGENMRGLGYAESDVELLLQFAQA